MTTLTSGMKRLAVFALAAVSMPLVAYAAGDFRPRDDRAAFHLERVGIQEPGVAANAVGRLLDSRPGPVELEERRLDGIARLIDQRGEDDKRHYPRLEEREVVLHERPARRKGDVEREWIHDRDIRFGPRRSGAIE